METIHQRIRRLRLAAKLSQESFANLVGVKYPSVQQWEREKKGTAPARKRQPRVAEVLGVSVPELMSGAPAGRTERNSPMETTEKDPRAAKVAALFYWLTEEQKKKLLDEVTAMATTNRLIAREISGKLNPATNARVEAALKKNQKKSSR